MAIERTLKKIVLAVSLVATGACSHMRPQAAAGCELPAYKLLPTVHDPELAPVSAVPTFQDALRSALQAQKPATETAARREVLMLSGGSQHGAFGAGFFRGLPQVPDYDIVTAVSTGALMSTPIFLANRSVPTDRIYPAYMKPDPLLGQLRHSNLEDLAIAYAISRESDLLHVRPFGFASAALNGSVATFAPLRRLVEGLISEDTLRSVAREARDRKRKLLVGITNLDDGYGYAVDLTKLADDAERQNRIHEARQCYIDALLASSTVPPGVPPITLKLQGLEGADLFMDGGARYGVFFDQLRDVATSDEPADVTLVVNGGLYGESWKGKDGNPVAKWSVLNVGFRAIDLLENQVYRLSVADQEQWATRPGSTLKVAFISNENLLKMTGEPDNWTFGGQSCAAAREKDARLSAPVEFYPSYMRCLIDYGQHRGALDPWNKEITGAAGP